MSSLGIQLTLMIGPTVALPAPAQYMDALQSIQITHNDTSRSGFQMTFQAGRPGLSSMLEYPLFTLPLLQVFNRVVIIVTVDAMPTVLMDGIITNQQLSPGDQPGSGTITVTGEDVSVMMDLEQKNAEYPAQPEVVIAAQLIAGYPQYGLIPMVIPPTNMDVPLPTDRTPGQHGTDLSYLKEMAGRYGYVFYVTPGPAPMANVAYWGPPVRLGIPQPALSANLGPETNINSISFQNNGLAPERVTGMVQDGSTNQSTPVETTTSTRTPPLAGQPAIDTQSSVRKTLFQGSGLTASQAQSRAQAQTDASTDNVVTASGDMDTARYGAILQARSLVGVRGVGYNFDGFYYVKSVTHNISRGSYKQSFSLSREGLTPTSPVVVP